MHPGKTPKGEGFEIDVNEGHYPNAVEMTLHQEAMPSTSKHWCAGLDLSKDFHVYAAEWNEKDVIFYLDGRELHRVPNTKAHLECPVIFSTAVITWAGPISDALDGKSMDVDWVRVYQRQTDAAQRH
jgi:beta-glucanase (GH16 family)